MDKVLIRQPIAELPKGTVSQTWAVWFDALIGNVDALEARINALTAAPSNAPATTDEVLAALAGKAESHHGHAIGDVTGLISELSGKAAIGHTHPGLAPAGGAAGRVLKKLSGTDYDFEWGVDNDTGGGGGVADGDKGDITVSGTGTVWTIDPGVVGTAKLGGDVTAAGKALLDDADAAAQRTTLGLGTAAPLNVPAAGNAAAGEVVKGSDTRLSDSRAPTAHTHTLAAITDAGTLAAKSTVATGDITDDAVTYAKLQNVSATDKLLGRSTAGAGDAEEIACTAAGRALIDDADATAQRATLGLGTAAPLNVPAAGDAAAGEVVKGSDTRLTNSRAPTAHTHVLVDVTDMTAAGRALADDVDAAAQRTTLGLGALATLAAVGTAQITDANVTNAKLANMPANTIKGNNTGASAVPLDLTVAQATAMLDVVTSTLKGLAPASGGGTANFLRADGAWSVPGGGVADGDKGDITVSVGGTVWTIDAGVVTNAKQASMTTKTYKGRTAGTTGDPEDVPVATLKTDLALVKADVGLSNVDNTTDVGKPVSTAQQTALNLKAPIASPSFTGTTLTLADAQDVVINATTGSKIGQATSKIGFFGVAPVVRPTAITQTYATASSTHAALTSLAAPAGGTGIAAGGWSSAANRDLAITSINALRTDVTNVKDVLNAVIDRLQLLGLLS